MRAVAHSPKFAKKVGVPQSVGKEFEMKDKEGKLMKKEGRGMAKADMQKKGMKGYKDGGIATSLKAHAAAPASKAHGTKKMFSGGLAAGHKQADGVATKGKTRGMEVKMKKGGMCK